MTKILMKWWVIAILPLADNFFVLIILAANSSPEYICDEYSSSVQKVRTSTVQYTNSDFAFQRHFLGNISLFLFIPCLQISLLLVTHTDLCAFEHIVSLLKMPLWNKKYIFIWIGIIHILKKNQILEYLGERKCIKKL